MLTECWDKPGDRLQAVENSDQDSNTAWYGEADDTGRVSHISRQFCFHKHTVWEPVDGQPASIWVVKLWIELEKTNSQTTLSPAYQAISRLESLKSKKWLISSHGRYWTRPAEQASPIVFVLKKDCIICLCVDHRRLNVVRTLDSRPILCMDEHMY